MKLTKKLVVLVVAAVATVSTSAFAVLPASVTASVGTIQTDGQAVFDTVFPVVAVFVGLVVIIKLFKRFTSKI